MKKLGIFSSIAISFILLTQAVSADCFLCFNKEFFVIPGIKISYIFGEKSAFLFGTEVSFGWLNTIQNKSYSSSGIDNNLFYGGVIGADFFAKKVRLSFNFEGQYWPYPGISAGPNLLIDKNDVKLGYNFSLYESIGVAAIYYNFSNFSDSLMFHEGGGYLKIPIPLNQ